jgi:hypothetical protein
MTVTITPQKSDSAVLIIAVCMAATSWATNDEGRGQLLIADNSNNTISGAQDCAVGTVNLTGTGTRETRTPVTLIARATPATTSAVTYKLRFGTPNVNVTLTLQNNLTTGQMYAIEVSA